MSVLINLLASTYLTRENTGAQVSVSVQEAGPDLRVSDWDVERAGSDAVKLRVPGAIDGYLLVERAVDIAGEFTLTLGEPDVQGATDTWHLESVGVDPDDAGVVYLVNRGFEHDLYLAADRTDRSNGTVVVGTALARGDAGAMWRIEDQGVTDARSVHLMYAVPKEPTQDAFIIEVRPQGVTFESEHPPLEKTPLGTYYCAVTFGDLSKKTPSGYFGIQTKADGSKMALFSMWDPPNQPSALNAHFTKMGPGVRVTTFGNEGTGSSARIDHEWHWGETMRFCLLAANTTDGTEVTAYFAAQGEAWFEMATCAVPYAEGKLLGGRFYSFVEDFKRDGLVADFEGVRSPWQRRHADFLNPWFRTASDTTLQRVTEARFTAYPHPFVSISAAPVANGWSLMTGVAGDYGTSEWNLGKTLHLGVTDGSLPDLPGASESGVSE